MFICFKCLLFVCEMYFNQKKKLVVNLRFTEVLKTINRMVNKD